ncbi:MAG TPA: sugar ABC transporter ATP-binding protein [Bryobacteraceae bacterium]|nr:sugar ABC transporter ATP-binding protein [Bryobacteraceae bacterium]
MADLLRAENISKHYDGVAALRGASFSVLPSEVHALVGENGAGKSTLAKIIAGAVSPDGGRILIDGEIARIASPLDAQRLGIAIIFQELDLFPHLTVAENIVIGNLERERRKLVNFRDLARFCHPFLAQAGLSCPAGRPLEELPIGEMQLVAIARALSLNARLIVMDESTSSLFHDSAERLFGLIADLKRRGISIVYVSHKMEEIFRICDRITVLRDGITVGTRVTAETTPGEIIRMMVGRDIPILTRSLRSASEEVVLSVSGLVTNKLQGVSFALRKGEVLGIAGLVGAGRSELGAALFGLDRIRSGSIILNGRKVHPRSSSEAIAYGIGLLPEDRKLQGLMMQMSVLENSTLAMLRRWQILGFLRSGEERNALEPVAKQLALKCASWYAPVSSLSGGNQQKVLLAKWLLTRPQVLFLDDPTRGIDVGAKDDIYRIIDDLAVDGKGIILVSSELPELLRCSDRILVLNEGRIAAVFDTAAATPEKIMAAAATAPVAEAME